MACWRRNARTRCQDSQALSIALQLSRLAQREHGVAQRLFQKLLKWAGEKQLRRIYLGTTEQFLAAHRFHEKNGFLQIAKSNLPGSFPIMSVDTKFYCLSLQTAANINPLVAWREAPHNHADQADSRHPSADGDAGFSRRDHRLSVKTR